MLILAVQLRIGCKENSRGKIMNARDELIIFREKLKQRDKLMNKRDHFVSGII